MTETADVPRNSAASLALGGVVAAHLALVALYAPRNVVLSSVPLVHDAFAVEWYRISRSLAAESVLGASGAYDPLVSAGTIVGATSGLAPRFFALGVRGLGALGVEPARAFGALVLGAHALVPLLGYAAARAFRVSRAGSVWGAALWSLLWFFDSLFHVAWHSGRVPWLVASALSVVSLGVALRALRGGFGWTLLAGTSFSLSVLAHPVATLPVLLASLAAAFTEPGLLPARRLRLAGLHAVPFVLFALPFRGGGVGSLSPLAKAFPSGPASFLWDALDIVGPGRHAEAPARTLFRALAVVGFLLARRRAWPEGVSKRPVSTLVGLGFLVGYLGDLLPVGWPVDPQLFVISATFLAAPFAGGYLADLRWRELYKNGTPRVRVLLGALALVIVPRAFRTVATFLPELLPARVVRSQADTHVSPLVGDGDPLPARLGHDAIPENTRRVASALGETAAKRGRVLVDDPTLAVLLATETTVPVLGPLGERGAPTSDADPTPLFDGNVPEAVVHAFLERYAVGWVVLGGPPTALDREDPALEPPIDVSGFRVRRVVQEPSFLLEGRGTVGRAELGGVMVQGAEGPRIALRFHHHPDLACRPGCRVERLPVSGDTAGFVVVPSPPPAFELYLRH